jgi:hypothetical protein
LSLDQRFVKQLREKASYSSEQPDIKHVGKIGIWDGREVRGIGEKKASRLVGKRHVSRIGADDIAPVVKKAGVLLENSHDPVKCPVPVCTSRVKRCRLDIVPNDLEGLFGKQAFDG